MATFHPALEAPAVQEATYWFVFRGFNLLVVEQGSRYGPVNAATAGHLPVPLVRHQYLGYLEQDGQRIPCYSGEVAHDVQPPEGMDFVGLRRLFGQMDETLFALSGRAVQIVDWDRTHQYCGRCGSTVEQLVHERAKRCSSCGLTTYPRISPAIIVSVERSIAGSAELLLARNQRHPQGFYSVLAGFVEPGESLEECVRREVKEEVGITLKNLRYFGSQSWPFPNSLMVAFTAEYASGELVLEEAEIAEAGWFGPTELPQVPPPISISRQLIDSFVARNTVI